MFHTPAYCIAVAERVHVRDDEAVSKYMSNSRCNGMEYIIKERGKGKKKCNLHLPGLYAMSLF